MRDRTERRELARAWDLVAFLLGERRASPGPVRPALLRALARLHRLDAALGEPALTRVSPEGCVDPETWSEWRAARQAALVMALRRGPAIRRVLDRLAPLQAIVLKGVALSELVYPSPGARRFVDFDVLVRARDLPEALRRLEDAGFFRHHPGDATVDAPDSPERQLGSADLELDLHQAFTAPARLPVDYDAVFARSIAWTAAAPNARLLAPDDAIAYQAIHAGCDELNPAMAPAVVFLDLLRMVARRGPFWGAAGGPALDFATAVRRAVEWEGERMFYASMAAGARLFPSLAPAAAEAARPLPVWLRVVLDRAVAGRAVPPGLSAVPRVEVLARKTLLLRPAARLRLLRYRLPQIAAALRHRAVKSL